MSPLFIFLLPPSSPSFVRRHIVKIKITQIRARDGILKFLDYIARRQVVRDLVVRNRASIVCLQETKLDSVDKNLILELLGPLFTDAFCFLPADGTRGGIILAFNSDLFNIQSSSATANTVSATIAMRASVASWSVTAVYGPQGDTEKLAFINELKAIRPTMLPAWLLLGDFNLLCKATEKSNATINRRLINAFTSALNSMELSEL